MIGFLFRLVGVFVLACAASLAVGDIARSLGAEALRMQDFGSALSLLPGSGAAPLASLGAFGSALASLPAVPLLATLAVFLLLAGRRRPPRFAQR